MTFIQKEKICCFTGHRKLPKKEIFVIKKHLIEILENLINKDVIYFGCGGAIGFDILAGFTVLELKNKYPYINLIMVLPCREQCINWTDSQKESYYELLSNADKVKYLFDSYCDGCMLERNKYMINCSGHCIAYLKQKQGGTFFTVNYAKRCGITVYNVLENIVE